MNAPAAWTRSEWPVCMQFATPIGKDATFLHLASEPDAATEWAARTPSTWLAR